jgi:hypothetical protein
MSSGTSTDSLQPWQFFVLAALASATAAIFLTQARGATAVVLVTVLMGAAALVGLATLRAVRPLVSPQEERAQMGERAREALEREKALTLRAIKELEFDRAMGKVSADDFRDMSGRLRARATRLMTQLDAGAGYREQIERDLANRLSAVGRKAGAPDARREAPVRTPPGESRVCAACATPNDGDARFCKECGTRLSS